MRAAEGRIDPGHRSTRSGLRMAGFIALILGLVLMAAGAYRMFSPAWSGRSHFMSGHRSFDQVSRSMEDEFRSKAWTSFSGFGMLALGMLCAAAGGVMLKLGYMGSIARYVAEEGAPVVADTVNYMGTNTREGVHALTESVTSGIRDGLKDGDATVETPATPTERTCPRCQGRNPAGSRFCNQCGRELEG